jgi:Ca-activated chloride channel family protein
MMKQVCGAFLLVLLGLSGLAQESAAPRVAIPLIANGSHHRPISITVKSLAITDQKIPVTGASLLRGADLPLELGVLIDTSTSQRDAYTDDTMKATQQFADKTIRRLEDRVFFLQFATTPQATGWLKKEQLQSIPIKVRIGGGTALYDALALACKKRMGPRDWREPTRRVLVLISDGMDDRSQITRDEAVAEVLKAGVMVFTINTEDTGMGLNSGEKVMKNFC